MKILVTYYSRTGNTRKIANEISNALECDVEEIIDTKNRSGPLGFIRAGRDAGGHKLTVLEDIKKDPVEYDLIIIGTPIWGGNVSTPIRTYITENHSKFNKVAFFCTAGGEKFNDMFADMEKLCETVPIATMGLSSKELKNRSYKIKLEEFIKKIRDK